MAVGGFLLLVLAGQVNAGGSTASRGECGWQATFAESDIDEVVYALASFDDGAGPELYAAGAFANAGNWAVNNVARWDGVGWSPLTGPSGSGVGLRDDPAARVANLRLAIRRWMGKGTSHGSH